VDNTKEFRCISLCSGYGGIELGLRRVIPHLRTVAYVEVEAFACTNLVAKIEAGRLDTAPIWTDIKTFNGQPFRDRIHLITGGYPCQPFSVAGKRQGAADPRHLWPYIERIIEAVRPVWCFFENVSGHLTIGFPEVYRSLRNLGYKVEAGLFTAAEVGAPHRRERLFILAYSRCNQQRGSSRNSEKENGSAQKTQQTDRRDPQSSPSRELADTTQQSGDRIRTTRPAGGNEHTNGCWPARPGQPQYEWERPRVVVNTKSKRNRRRPQEVQQENGGQKSKLCGDIKSPSETTGQAKSRLGRAAYGLNSRVDRLRLLGNGVVPASAEKAFVSLMGLFKAK